MKQKLKTALLQMDNLVPYDKNLERLLGHIDANSDCDLIVAPEVCLTDYDYEHIDEAVAFSQKAERILCEKVGSQILVLTLLKKRGNDYVNEAIVVHGNKVVHRQAKHKLFLLGNEDRYLKAGSVEEITRFEVDRVCYGVMICFEMRFKELWQRLEGCDVIVVPSQWGLPRKRHLEILAGALGVMNQCYVALANSAREDMARSSGLYSPDGGVVREDMAEVIRAEIDTGFVKKMRRYLKMQ